MNSAGVVWLHIKVIKGSARSATRLTSGHAATIRTTKWHFVLVRLFPSVGRTATGIVKPAHGQAFVDAIEAFLPNTDGPLVPYGSVGIHLAPQIHSHRGPRWNGQGRIQRQIEGKPGKHADGILIGAGG
eukprot:scaffold39140_cov176-Amphora_coffeaeformis.AAC.1